MRVHINMKDNTIEEIIFKEAVENRNVYLIDEIDRNSIFKTKNLMEKIVKLDRINGIKPEDAEPINLHISSYGGSVHSTLYLISYIRHLQKKKYRVFTFCDEIAMSGGFFLLIVGDKRFSYEYSTILFHDPRDFAYGTRTTEDAKRDFLEFKKEWDRLKEITMQYTNISEEKLEYYVGRKEDWIMFPSEALEFSVIDQIL